MDDGPMMEPSSRSGLRVLELYSGLGGLAAALAPACAEGVAEVVGAIDVNRDALDVYGRNFPRHPRTVALIESLSARRLASFEADLWWASPPCQPFTRRGLRRDLHDPRAATFRALVERIEGVKPRYLALENVAPFESSDARDLLLGALERAGYESVVEQVLCPSELGVPNRRPRYYLLASRGGVLQNDAFESPSTSREGKRLAHYVTADALEQDGLLLDEEQAWRYRHAIHIVEAHDPDAVTTCFTSAYGRSPVRSGSYLATEHGPRRFSPAEVLRLLGFPASFDLGKVSTKKSWRLAGNSLSIPAVRHVLSRIPQLSRALVEDDYGAQNSKSSSTEMPRTHFEQRQGSRRGMTRRTGPPSLRVSGRPSTS